MIPYISYGRSNLRRNVVLNDINHEKLTDLLFCKKKVLYDEENEICRSNRKTYPFSRSVDFIYSIKTDIKRHIVGF